LNETSFGAADPYGLPRSLTESPPIHISSNVQQDVRRGAWSMGAMKRRRWMVTLATAMAVALSLGAHSAMALDTSAMARKADSLFADRGMKTRTVCTDNEARITLLDSESGPRPSADRVIDALAVIGKAFNLEFRSSYFYRMAVYSDGRKWIETLAGNCRDSFQDNTISHCYYKVNF
jgi:hypothetical protein